MNYLLIITNLFPNRMQPNRGIFNFQQFRALAEYCQIQAISPLPWSPMFVSSKGYYQVPSQDNIEGIPVCYPRHLIIPKTGRRFYGYLMYPALLKSARDVQQHFDFEAILATWAYPDVYAASLVARKLGKPFFAKVHGTDINDYADDPARRKRIVSGLNRATKVFAVSCALKERMEAIGVDPEKIVVLPNGVDTNLFCPKDRNECEQRLGLEPGRKRILFVGNLVEVKGVSFLLEAMAQLDPSIHLAIVGNGPLRLGLERLADSLGIGSTVLFAGARPHTEIPDWMNGCDVFCLPSLTEGCPNVVIEALACGCPVIASQIGGIPDMISCNNCMLIPPGDPHSIAEAIRSVLEKNLNREAIRNAVFRNSWQATALKLHNEMQASPAYSR